MSAFKITDVRVRQMSDGTTRVYLDGLGVGEPLDSGVTRERAALMLSVFNLGRDCYWDITNRSFTTSLADVLPQPNPNADGRVESWDVRVPADGGEQVSYVISVLPGDPPSPPTSGNAATLCASLAAADDSALLLIGILQSQYCRFERGELRNTEILSW